MFAVPNMKNGNVIINADQQKNAVDIRIYGYISDWSDASGNTVADLLAKHEGKFKNLNIYVNSNGGSVTEGIAIFNILKRSSFSINIYVDGVAASMASVLLQLPGANRYMAKYTRLMMHSVSGGAHGSAAELRSTADMIESFENDLIDIVSERTGVKAADVRTKWFNGKDNWLTPQEALDAKLIDGIVDGKVKEEPKNLSNVNDTIDFYGNQITNFFNANNDTMDLTAIINALQMQAGSTPEQIAAQVTKVVNENATFKKDKKTLEDRNTVLEDAAKDAREKEVKDLIDDAVKTKKITEAQRPVYEALAKSDFTNAKAALDAIAPVKNLRDIPGGGTETGIPENRKGWTFQDWQKKDGKGLQNLKETNKEAFDTLYKQAFPQA